MQEQPTEQTYLGLKAELGSKKESYERRDHRLFNGGTYSMPNGDKFFVVGLKPESSLKAALGKEGDSSFNYSMWHNQFLRFFKEMGGVSGVDGGVASGIVKAEAGETIDAFYQNLERSLASLNQ